MENSWFEEYLQQQLPDEHKDHPLLTSTAILAADIATSAGADIFSDKHDQALEGLERSHALRRFEQALAKAILARLPNNRSLGSYAYRLNHAQDGNASVIQLRQRLSVNTAGPKALESLPEIGETLAERIVEYRAVHGLFSEEDNPSGARKLSDVRGISADLVKKIRHTISYESTDLTETPIFVPGMDELRSKPNLEGLIQAIQTGIAISGKPFAADDDLVTRLHRELGVIQDEIEGARWQTGVLKGVRASEVSKIETALTQHSKLPHFNNLTDETASLIFNSQYPAVVGELIDSATTSIQLLMFYIVPGSSGVDQLLQKLIAAKARGVAVSVILDQDREGDVYNSRNINKAAFELLKSNGIAVSFDEKATLLHAKLLIIDDKVSVVGSHNWTAGSFFNYEDVSVVVHSSSVTSAWTELFGELG